MPFNLFFTFASMANCHLPIDLFLTSYALLKMHLGSWCLGFGLGNLDGWDGDYSIYIFPAGMFCCTGVITILGQFKHEF